MRLLLLPLLLLACAPPEDAGTDAGDAEDRPWESPASEVPAGSAAFAEDLCGWANDLAALDAPEDAWSRYLLVDPEMALLPVISEGLMELVRAHAEDGLPDCLEYSEVGAFTASADDSCALDYSTTWEGGLVVDLGEDYDSVLFNDLDLMEDYRRLTLAGRTDIQGNNSAGWGDSSVDFDFPAMAPPSAAVPAPFLGTAGSFDSSTSTQPIWGTDATWPTSYGVSYAVVGSSSEGVPSGVVCAAWAASPTHLELTVVGARSWTLQTHREEAGCYSVSVDGSESEEAFCPDLLELD